MNELDELRKNINRIDAEMLRLFQERMKTCAAIAAYKKQSMLSVRDTARENELISRNCALLTDTELKPYYIDFMHAVFDISCSYQSSIIDE